MSKLGYVCSLMVVLAALGCGGDDDGAAGASGSTLCDQQTARAMNECNVTVPGSGGTGDAGVACTGQALCIAQCTQAATCADLMMATTQFMGPFITCSVGCIQQP